MTMRYDSMTLSNEKRQVATDKGGSLYEKA
jgi:hypothetical protein